MSAQARAPRLHATLAMAGPQALAPVHDDDYDSLGTAGQDAQRRSAYRARSDRLRALAGVRLDLAYGQGPRQCLDYFPAPLPGPVLVFVGSVLWRYWSKEDFAFLVRGPLAHGIHVALLSHTPVPRQTLSGVVDEVRLGLAWLGRHAGAFGGDGRRMLICGWSAGAHLAALCLDEPGVVGGLAVSGIYDLEPLLHTHGNDDLALDVRDALRLSPQHRMPGLKPLVLACGEHEPLALRRQAANFSNLRAHENGTMLTVPGCDHFSILEELADPAGTLMVHARALLATGSALAL
ncbi:carboxylesterase family protein [Verticiella sediminum]|uniref:Carboxylesterase family protein n=1 Tax=Verticiella sediminum TaxID=1247510 RepID=A0A556A7C6_9BURK|nr:carboxylesterase family protein [Verticiella sediminum]TSH88783.1 carboxylesterase family protein [Verticiella sediminum]